MRQIHDNLWVHEDAMKLGPVTLPLRMTIARLNDDGLWVRSPAELSPKLKAEVDGLGRVDSILAPSNGHNLWLQTWGSAYP